MSLSIKWLKNLSLAYLALPIFMFFFLWLKLFIAIGLSLILCYGLSTYYLSNKSQNTVIKIPLWQFVSMLAIITLWLLVSGSGGMGLQGADYLKPNTVMRDIMLETKPISYQINNAKYYLCTYIAFYLPAPVIFGSFGWSAVLFGAFVWTWLGVVLCILWLMVLANNFSPWVLVIFVFIGGWDIMGIIHNMGLIDGIKTIYHEFYEKQPFFATMIDPKLQLYYPGTTQVLFWSPQHAIGIWLTSGLFFYEFLVEKNIRNSPIYLALMPLWTPFVLLGLAPYFVYALVVDGIKKMITPANLLMCIILFVLGWFIVSLTMGQMPKGVIFYKPIRLLGYIYQAKAYFIFLCIEIFVWAIPVYYFMKNEFDAFQKKIFYFTIVLLCIIPLYYFGINNDWVLRVSMPGLFLLWVWVLRAFPKAKALFTTIWLLGTWDAVFFILLSLHITNFKIKNTAPKIENLKNSAQTYIDMNYPIAQHVTTANAPFFKYLAK